MRFKEAVGEGEETLRQEVGVGEGLGVQVGEGY